MWIVHKCVSVNKVVISFSWEQPKETLVNVWTIVSSLFHTFLKFSEKAFLSFRSCNYCQHHLHNLFRCLTTWHHLFRCLTTWHHLSFCYATWHHLFFYQCMLTSLISLYCRSIGKCSLYLMLAIFILLAIVAPIIIQLFPNIPKHIIYLNKCK